MLPVLPDFHPVFLPCPLWVIPYFLPCHQSSLNLPCFPSQHSQSSAKQPRALLPSHSNPPQVWIQPPPPPRKCGTGRAALPSSPGRAQCLWDCLVGVTAPLGAGSEPNLGQGLRLNPALAPARFMGMEHPGLCLWQRLGMREALISNPNQSMIP